jgi:hypothetical protein
MDGGGTATAGRSVMASDRGRAQRKQKLQKQTKKRSVDVMFKEALNKVNNRSTAGKCSRPRSVYGCRERERETDRERTISFTFVHSIHCARASES